MMIYVGKTYSINAMSFTPLSTVVSKRSYETSQPYFLILVFRLNFLK
jgi:hypothetical protein